MSGKAKHSPTGREAKPGKPGTFRHVAEPATMSEVLRACGLTAADFRRVQADVHRRLAKEPAHARQVLARGAGRARLKAMIPTCDVDIKQPQHAELFRTAHRQAIQTWQLG